MFRKKEVRPENKGLGNQGLNHNIEYQRGGSKLGNNNFRNFNGRLRLRTSQLFILKVLSKWLSLTVHCQESTQGGLSPDTQKSMFWATCFPPKGSQFMDQPRFWKKFLLWDPYSNGSEMTEWLVGLPFPGIRGCIERGGRGYCYELNFVLPHKFIHWSSNSLRMWPYLEIESLPI